MKLVAVYNFDDMRTTKVVNAMHITEVAKFAKAGKKITENVKVIPGSEKKCCGLSVVEVEIDGELYVMFSDNSCLKVTAVPEINSLDEVEQ